MEVMSNYIRFCRGTTDPGKLIKQTEVSNYLEDNEKDYYTSLFNYNDKHLEIFKKTGSIAGIKDVTTNKLLFDFDSKTNLELAFDNAVELIERLKKNNIKEDDIEIYFSGNKGIHISVTLNRDLTPDLVYSLAVNKYGRGLETLDKSIYNASRIIRVPFTKHDKSGLYKIPLDLSVLQNETAETIKSLAQNLDGVSEYLEQKTLNPPISNPGEDFFNVPEEKKLTRSHDYSVDITKVPKGWRNCKWSLLQGNFKAGERHMALTVLAATYRGLGFDKETAYYNCKAALKKQSAKTDTDEFDKKELWENIIEKSVYTDNWEGGQYTCQKPGWLQTYCQSLDHPCDKHSDSNIVQIEDAFGMFKDYATNIDTLTIKTGIPVLDKKLRMTIGMSIGIVAPPGVGKTSVALQMLNNLSKTGERALFLSYDMFHALVFQKLIQKHFEMQPDEIFDKFRVQDNFFENEVIKKIKEEYSNVDFCFKSGQTYEQILDTIKECEEKSGKKIKLVVCDYNELVLTDMSDGTSSSNYVAQKMREIANVQQCCVLSLFQPNKLAGSPSDEITSYRSAKGGSGIEQSVSVMLGMSRPGYDPRKPENDKYMTINCLKNRMGSLFATDLHWDGLTGSLRELEHEEKMDLKALREIKKEQKEASEKEWG